MVRYRVIRPDGTIVIAGESLTRYDAVDRLAAFLLTILPVHMHVVLRRIDNGSFEVYRSELIKRKPLKYRYTLLYTCDFFPLEVKT